MPSYFLEAAILAILAAPTVRLTYYGLKGKFIAKTVTPYSQAPIKPHKKILCLGDSFGVGVGASHPRKSYVGNLGQDFPNLSITNHCRNGSTTARLFKHFKKQNTGQYDIALLMVGGMDVIKHTPLKKLENNLTEFLLYLRQCSSHIVVIIPNDVGNMPLYHFPINHILNYRAKKVQKIFRRLAEVHGCKTVDQNVNMLFHDMKRYYSSDKAHPNDEGYKLWYKNSIKITFVNLCSIE